MNQDIKLIGMKMICRHLQVSESTALIWHREYDLPIRKLRGIWITTRPQLDAWFANYCQETSLQP